MTSEEQSKRDVFPLWAQVLDVVAVAALVVSMFVLVGGGFIAHVGPLHLSSHSILRPLLWAAVLVGIRHAVVRTPPLHRRIAARLTRLYTEFPPSLVMTALVSRVAVLVVGYFAVLTIGGSPSFRLSADPLLNLPARFDAGWYGGIALDGYRFGGSFERQQSVAFFPAYPMMMRFVGYGIGAFKPGSAKERRMLRALWGGVVISLLAFVWAALYVARLARDIIGEARALDAVALISTYPFAVFFSAPYTEAVFLLAAAAAFYHYRRREWPVAVVWGMLAGLTRPNGCLLSIVLVCVTIEHWWCASASEFRQYPLRRAILAAAAPAVAMLAYSVYVRQLTGEWFGWAHAHVAWGRSFQGLAAITRGFEGIAQDGILDVFAAVPFNTLNAFGVILALALLWPVFRRIGLAGGLFVLVNLVPPLLAGGVLSMGRLTSTLFPVFLALAATVPKSFLAPLLIAFAIGQGLAATLFFTWRALF